jgi:prevent-host-death family protein
MSVVTIHQAKTNLSRLIQKASEGEEVIIARGSKPVARLGSGRRGKRETPAGIVERQVVCWTGVFRAPPD